MITIIRATVFPYFPIDRVDVSCQSLATYVATDLLWLGRLCKWALTVHTSQVNK